jgi:hypothetical protein
MCAEAQVIWPISHRETPTSEVIGGPKKISSSGGRKGGYCTVTRYTIKIFQSGTHETVSLLNSLDHSFHSIAKAPSAPSTLTPHITSHHITACSCQLLSFHRYRSNRLHEGGLHDKNGQPFWCTYAKFSLFQLWNRADCLTGTDIYTLRYVMDTVW